MSVPKIRILGCLAMALFVASSARGGSIVPDSRAFSSWSSTGNQVGAENLASGSNLVLGTTNSFDPGFRSANSTGSTGGLFLGVYNPNSESSNAPVATVAGPWTAPVVTASTPQVASSPAPTSADAFINFGSGPYPESSSLTTGTAQPFFTSPVFTHLFGSSGPTSTDITNFENEVVSTIKSTYNNAGLAINLTTDPNVPAAHTMSVVSGLSYAGNPDAIGITDVGHNGFSFIDKFGAAQTVDQLAIAIGHNLSHELMHAFGIANHPEQTGPYVDAASATFQTLADPSTAFSPVAASLLSTLNFQAVGTSVTAGTQKVDGDQVLIPSPVPEPSTLAIFVLAGGLIASRRRSLVLRSMATSR